MPYLLLMLSLSPLSNISSCQPLTELRQAGERKQKVILDWLRKSRNVEKIFHLSVTDSLHEPHSEETIEEAVKHFDIEILDWRRIDLSIRTI
jgi:hypothetical protein